MRCHLVWGLLAAVVWAEDAAILRPLNHTVVAAGVIRVIGRAPAGAKLLLDGKPIEAQQPAPGVYTAELRASAGRHALELGAASVEFAVVNGPAEWKAFRTHPPAAQCTTCHTARNGVWQLRTERVSEACAGCHDLMGFAKVHMHNTEVLKDCQECHQPHGSIEKSHLKMAKETACKLCHG